MRFFLTPRLLAEVITYPRSELNWVAFCPSCGTEWGRVESQVGRAWQPRIALCRSHGDGSFFHFFYPSDPRDARILFDCLSRSPALLSWEMEIGYRAPPFPPYQRTPSSWTPQQLLPWSGRTLSDSSESSNTLDLGPG